ncbi:MAG: hypothetical protein P1P89_17065 [Desulfobacterales bacterium]|nr:hypothetical protein [Desulfobacterales bacterium]
MPEGYHIIAPGSVLVDHGPVHMTISAWRNRLPAEDPAVAGAKKALRLLQVLSEHLPIARKPIAQLTAINLPHLPQVLERMIHAAALLNQGDVTPMAAVAGAFSDMVKENVISEGADRVIVNNGGDIAFCRGKSKQPVRIGLVADLARGNVTHVVDLPDSSGLSYIEGVATSGFGGRSLTKGIASAVTCFAKSSALADAAATAVANAATCDHPGIERCSAEMIDALTDIQGHLVTCRIGGLSPQAVSRAVAGAREHARLLYDQEMIAAAIVFIQNQVGIWPPKFARLVQACPK